MSTRFYRLFQRGGVQRRVYLPNFWLKLVKPTHEQPPDVVQFACSMEMTRYDIKNYLEKIYNINVVKIDTRIELGKTKREPRRGYIVKDDDTKYAYVTLPRGEKFEFPNLYEGEHSEQRISDKKSIEEVKKQTQKYLEKTKDRPGVPGWFSA